MKKVKLTIFILFAVLKSFSNNINISNVTSGSNATGVYLTFDITWDNSWKNSINKDAAWVFFKWHDLDGTWRHLNLTNTNNFISFGYSYTIPADLTGIMIYRASAGAGNLTITGIQVGVTNYPGSFDIKAFALEMVAIPLTDAYYLGDGATTNKYQTANTGNPFLVQSTVLSMGTGFGQLNDIFNNGVLASGFPIGYSTSGNIYMMKHEISQGAYRDFLNTLTYDQQDSRIAGNPNQSVGFNEMGSLVDRSSIQIKTSGINNTTPAVFGCNLNNNGVWDEASDGEWIPISFLIWSDLAAFLDWAALRPMTELEYEKSCRGPLVPVAGEVATGTAAIANYQYQLQNAGTASEAINFTGSVINSNIICWATNQPGGKPMRVGICATANATRISAGAGYYGCLDLTGNVLEMVVSTGCIAGRSFIGIEGDGTLTISGYANEDYWPGINGNNSTTTANGIFGGVTGVTNCAGFSYRGGTSNSSIPELNVSYRFAPFINNIRFQGYGGRGVKVM